MSNPTVLLETTSGDILIELFPDKAPDTVANFLQYVDDGFYANTIFPSRDPRLHDPGRRPWPPHGREGHPRPHQERSRQRSFQ